jgi:hypothetical protein
MTHDPKELITALLLFGVSIAGFAFFIWLLFAFARAIARLLQRRFQQLRPQQPCHPPRRRCRSPCCGGSQLRVA